MAKKKTTTPKTEKEKGTSLWDYINAITFTKRDLMSEDPDSISVYANFMVNRALSQFPDTILYANELNQFSLDKDQHFAYLINSIRPKKRFAKWPKKSEDDDLEAVKEYFKYNEAKAKTALSLLSPEQLETIREKLSKGGK